MTNELALAPVDDAALVARIRAGDSDAWAEVYRRYGDRLYTLCWSVLRTDEAADATQEAFLLAFQHLGSLRDPTALRPWLFRIAWTEALRRGKKRTRSEATDAMSLDAPSPDPGPEDLAHQRELQRLVWDAAAGLPDEDRVVLELNVHQGLHGDELAKAIGVSSSYARKLVQRVRARTDRAVGALLVASSGRRDCDELRELLGTWDGEFTPLIRKRVARHIDGCRICSDRRATMASPVSLFAAAPVLAAPAWVGENVMAASLAAASPAGAAASSAGLHLAGLAPRRTLETAVAAVATTVVVALLVLQPWRTPSAPVTVAGPGGHEDLAIAVDGAGRAFVAWQDLDTRPAGSMVRHQTADGWSEPINLSAGFVNPGAATLVAKPNGQMCAFFHGFPDDTSWIETWGLYERCWDDDELSAPRQVTSIGEYEEFYLTTSWAPAFDSDGDLHTAWTTPPSTVGVHHQVVSSGDVNGVERLVIDSGGRLHVLFYNGDTGDIDHRWSGDAGETWSVPFPVAGYAAFDVSADGQGGIHFTDTTDGNVFDHHWSLETGWAEGVDVTGEDSNYMTYGGLAGLGDGGAAVAWSATLGGKDLTLSERHGDGGFGPPAPIAAAIGVPISEAELAAEGDHLHVAWITGDGTVTYIKLR